MVDQPSALKIIELQRDRAITSLPNSKTTDYGKGVVNYTVTLSLQFLYLRQSQL